MTAFKASAPEAGDYEIVTAETRRILGQISSHNASIFRAFGGNYTTTSTRDAARRSALAGAAALRELARKI